ncbi:transforming growth factor beta receptor type 3-like isoform X2 [Sinocyclocheilus anshuiensis]|uniref:transforming growth factor beta receptor type 3-like isoform X2 n=1 Tax=Sinocyclocheilus anshuiensis TaxID=1608454 RepID=UPI0007B93EAF|nr:PREDICTED: transforming growth factor beta receptor type 3-like isoform X2 [Sinocyclocheilus anshuiensis]
MMPWTGSAVFFLLLAVVGTAVSSRELQCSMWPVGALHPVQARLECFEVGTGCAAREGGAKETHVISVGKASNKQVTVVLRPLTISRPVNRLVILVLCSQHAVRWVLKNEGLSHNINVMVQVSLNSTAESSSLSICVKQIQSLPPRPRVLLRWILQRHATISSLTHTVRANRVYLRLGEDPSMPSECCLRPLFLSQNYLASELQEQEVHGCVPSDQPVEMEVHIIRLWSSGSGLCSSLQVEASVSLLPPVARSGYHRIVMILSSAAPVNWTLVAPEVRGHVRVYSSNSVSLPYRSQAPSLSMTSTVTSDLLSTPDLLEWANQNGFPKVTSYTEADLANRFVIRLREGGKGSSDGGQDDISSEPLTCQCGGGALTVTVDTQMLQAALSRAQKAIFPVSTVTLRDHSCWGEFNGSHFLLVFPVISCGTEVEMDEANGRVHYTNTVFLWKRKPLEGLNNGTGEEVLNETSLIAIHISCEASLIIPVSPADVAPSSRPEEALHFSPWVPRGHAAPVLSMELFVTEAYERRAVGPCVITAYDRVYVQISVSSGVAEAVELQSCLVSPLSDPQAHSGWSVIRDSCPSDPSFTLSHRETRESTDSTGHDEDEKADRKDDRRPSQPLSRWRQTASRSGDERARRNKDKRPDRLRARKPEERRRKRREGECESANTLRFSFILRPIFNNPIQFLHCRLHLCASDEGPSGATARICADGPQIPALTHTTASQQCEYRNLSRPVLVTYPAGFLAPAGKTAQKPSETSPAHSETDEGLVFVVVFSAFVMGLCLMGALWCIYSHTGRPDVSQRGGVIEDSGLRNPPPALMELTSAFHEAN